MKLKDFKNEPDKYNFIVKEANERGISVNDETDISDIISNFHSINAMALKAGRMLDKKRQGLI